ncbi:MAG: UPF0280 family protein [Bacteroidota bacterium]
MTEYEPRVYREEMEKGRFRSFVVEHYESDLWIGVDPASYNESMIAFVQERVKEIRETLEVYISKNSGFRYSLEPVGLRASAPLVAVRMARASLRAAVGPMAAVAGAFAQEIGNAVINEFHPRELIIENGGDCFISIAEPATVAIHAGKSPLSGMIGLRIPPEASPLGVCTSSGTVGPSLSFGCADAVMIASRDAALADAYASCYGNRIRNEKDVNKVIQDMNRNPKILSGVIILNEHMGVCGNFEIQKL